MSATPSRKRDFAWILIAYLFALAAACAVGAAMRGQHPIAVVAVADLAATAVVFGFSVAFDNSSFYDPYWSVAPVPIAFFWLLGAPPHGAVAMRQALVFALVLWWATRLTYNWARGWEGLSHEDWRYVDYRTKTGRYYWLVSFAGIHLAPTLWVLLGSLALYPALAVGSEPPNLLDIPACAVTAGAIWIEMRADKELRRFRLSPGRRPEDILKSGLWRWSRHPNYLGEVGFWWGLFLFGLASSPSHWWIVIGPLSITGLFLFVSLPLIETRMQERRPDYAAHMAKSSLLLPRRPRD